MRDKKPYREQLLEQKRSTEQRNTRVSLFEFVLILAFALAGETEDLAASRLISAVLFIILYRSYNQMNRMARRSLLYFDAEAAYLEAAKNNDPEKVKRFLELLYLQKLNCFDPDTGKNALHFAVSTGALDVINLLIMGDKEASKLGEHGRETLGESTTDRHERVEGRQHRRARVGTEGSWAASAHAMT